jgi:endonuclease G
LIPAVASADDNYDANTDPVVQDGAFSTIIGGQPAPEGKWPDAAAILYGGQQACSGTLIAPTVVLTAGHCTDPQQGLVPDKVMVGGVDLNNKSAAEVINVATFKDLTQADISVLVLSKAAATKPRPLATGWAKFDIKNDAPVALVGFGTTNANGSTPTSVLREVMSTITDFDCSFKPGCRSFEIGAGGGGIDTCPGDSGGPMYLTTSYGDFLIGVTSRAYSNATRACGEGGIYGRPDLLVDFIEAAAGVPVVHGVEPALEEPLLGIRGDAAEAQIVHNDPKAGASHTFQITSQPMKGQAAVSSDGVLRVCIAADATPGDTDSVVVTVADASDPNRSVAKRLTVSVAANEAVGGTCDPNAFGSGDGGGCCDSGGKGAGGSALLSVFALVGLLRRRRSN